MILFNFLYIIINSGQDILLYVQNLPWLFHPSVYNILINLNNITNCHFFFYVVVTPFTVEVWEEKPGLILLSAVND